MQTIQWRSKGNVPNGHLRNDYSVWVDDFLKCEGLEKQRAELKAERTKVKELPRSLKDIEKSFRESQKNLKDLKIKELANFIKNSQRMTDPASQLRFILPDSLLRIPEISDEMINEAFKILETSWEDSISDADRAKKFKAIDSELKKIDAELAKYPDLQEWKIFVNEWQMLQARCNSGISPQGFPLREVADPEEIEAFRKLNLGQLVDPRARFSPAQT